MLIETIVNLLMFIAELLVKIFPEINIEIPENLFVGLEGAFRIAGYLFPISALLPIVTLSIGLDLAQIIIAIVIRIKSVIPGMGA